MNERIARKDIRRDEFMETLGKGVEYTQSHVRIMVMAGTAVVAVALAAWGVYAWRANVRYGANDALGAAMRVWGASIDAASPKPLDADAPTFASEDARRKRAQELFEALVKEPITLASSGRRT